MIEFAVGVVVGAAFAPFWMKLYGWIKMTVMNFMKTPPPSP